MFETKFSHGFNAKSYFALNNNKFYFDMAQNTFTPLYVY